eukprot:COSAG06_NODE_941_length_11384_cov_4.377492_8_plen_99_part_00
MEKRGRFFAGYIGDAHTSLETSLQNFNSVPFYTKWAADIGDIQGYPAHTGCGYGQCKLPQGLGDPEGETPAPFSSPSLSLASFLPDPRPKLLLVKSAP